MAEQAFRRRFAHGNGCLSLLGHQLDAGLSPPQRDIGAVVQRADLSLAAFDIPDQQLRLAYLVVAPASYLAAIGFPQGMLRSARPRHGLDWLAIGDIPQREFHAAAKR